MTQFSDKKKLTKMITIQEFDIELLVLVDGLNTLYKFNSLILGGKH